MIRTEISSEVQKVLRQKFGKRKLPEIMIEAPENSLFGNYTLNTAKIAKRLDKKPEEVAAELARGLESPKWRAEALNSFINFTLQPETLLKELGRILKRGRNYGRAKAKKEKLQVEFISANPTGPLTLANGRGGFLGDALSRALEHYGYEIEREYYINDAGNQIRTLGFSFLAASGIVPDAETYYHGEYIASWAKAHARTLKRMKDDPEALGRIAAKDFLKKLIKPSVEKKMRIRFDRWTSEYADVRGKDYVNKVLALFRKRKLVYKKDGATWLQTTGFGDDKDRVLITRDGFPTYFLADAGHYLETKKRGFSKINIVGADHHGYVSRIQAVARIVGLRKSEVMVAQLVRLVSGGKEVRMSKRRGTFVTMDELVDEVGLDAARYFFLEKSTDTHINFDLDLAKERSVKNPVYYIQYAHARMASIFRKAKNRSISNLPSSASNRLKENEELALVKKMIQFPEVVEDTAHDYRVHRLTRYAYELARAFHNFYEKRKVITGDKELTKARLALVRAAQIVLQNTLHILGISAPNRM